MFKTNNEIISIEAKATDPIPTGVVFWSHDKGTAKMIFRLRKENVNQTLSEGTIIPILLEFLSATAENGRGRHIYHAVIEDAINGIVSIVLEDNILGYQGRVDGSIYIELPDSRSLDTAGRFTFHIKRSPIDEDVPELEAYYWQGFNEIMEQYHESIAEIKSEAKALLDNLTADVTTVQNELTNLNARIDEISKKIDDNDVFTKAESSANVINQIGGAESAVLKKDLLADGTEGTASKNVNNGMVPFTAEDYTNLLSKDGVVRSETLVVGDKAAIEFEFTVIETLEKKYPFLFDNIDNMIDKVTLLREIIRDSNLEYTSKVGLLGNKAVSLFLFTPYNNQFTSIVADLNADFITFKKTESRFKTQFTQTGTQRFRLATSTASDGVTQTWIELKDIRLTIEIEANGKTIIESFIAHYHGENLATQEEAESGESDEKLMTPRTTRQSIEKRSVLLAGDQDVDGKKNFLVMPTVGGKEFLTTDDLALLTPLFSGVTYLRAVNTITLTKSLSDCKSGIVLKFNPYNSESGSAYTSQTSWCFIPKHHVTTNASGQNTFCPIYKQDGTFVGAKVITVSPTTITGADVNATGALLGYVLTAIYEV